MQQERQVGHLGHAVGDDSYAWTGSSYCTATATWPAGATNGALQVSIALTGGWPSGTPLNIYGLVGDPDGTTDPAGWQSLGMWTVP